MVKIPAPEAGQIPEGADSLQRQDSVPETGQQVVQIDFRALRAGDPLDVALLLPLATGGEPNGNYLEFYQGFLLGLDSVKLKYGRSVNVDLYNTARDTARIREIVEKVAATDANILITGENGTGKEILAREIHRLSPRGARPMLNVDMGAISESLFESELFGHERGAFTDAHESRPGKFEAANGSSLFMDELGNLPLPLQTKLLTVLQSRNVTRLGSNKVIPVDIRLISATNKDIPEMVKQGMFREDLFYRINTIHLELPPLRERGDDILLFIDCFLRKFTSKYQRQEIRIHEQTVEKLRSYHWPGNIRELQHTIEKAVILCEGSVIRPKDILVKQTWQPQATATVPNLEEVERRAIETAILQNNGNLTAAAEQLGVSRQTLYNKLKRFKL